MVPKIYPKQQNICKTFRLLPWKIEKINPMGLSAPLDNSYHKKNSETSNCHQNPEMIALECFKGWNKWALVPFWTTLKPTVLMKHQTFTKTLRWLPWYSQSIDGDKSNDITRNLATDLPQEICYKIQGKVSGPMNADPVNGIYTRQQSRKIGYGEELVK